LFGGGTDNITFLLGEPAALTNPAAAESNAQALKMIATFWIEPVEHVIVVPFLKPGHPPLTIRAETGQPVPIGAIKTRVIDYRTKTKDHLFASFAALCSKSCLRALLSVQQRLPACTGPASQCPCLIVGNAFGSLEGVVQCERKQAGSLCYSACGALVKIAGLHYRSTQREIEQKAAFPKGFQGTK
jgi:hypothetical protein